MKAVLQRVKYASVAVGGEVIGECREGLLVLLGVAEGDTEEDARLLAAKILKLRIFCDENGKMNLSLLDIGGELLIRLSFGILTLVLSRSLPITGTETDRIFSARRSPLKQKGFMNTLFLSQKRALSTSGQGASARICRSAFLTTDLLR